MQRGDAVEGEGKGSRRLVTRPAEYTAGAVPGHECVWLGGFRSALILPCITSETHQLPALGLCFFSCVC